ncbi:ABC transporter ATP-binding protein [Permianibacter aggregans]|uniref:ABC-2 type transport system ATP-binding protein n=1 Tax=Permianibacter aggregans TaxID=1510150 RepID=A0A4R6UKK4_9GAMM|nr:ABC transporter ATP-binding protein [Permianibacter aggregans]QGX39213.1 ABC transporter ATP-binding protein [Permianibacter aggregans]TDQ46019.1 ABC-2 type transport system ATP-binding protein [Permianibacter aggregans]
MNETVIDIRQLNKAFDKQTVLNGIDVQVKHGEVIGLLGLNGAGKTTLMETMLGFSPASSGQVRLFGRDEAVQLSEPVKKRIGFVPQTDELMDTMSVAGYLKLISSFYPNWDQAMIDRLLDEWVLPGDKKISKLSIGQRQKVSILSAIGHHPELLVLDEPVASLDPKARRQFLQTLIDIAGGGEKTVLFSTHIVSDVERIADRVWLIKDGKILVDAAMDEIKDTTVRLHFPNGELPELGELHVLHQRQAGSQKVWSVTGWNPMHEQRWRQRFGDALNIERLSLEDIFLELHG